MPTTKCYINDTAICPVRDILGRVSDRWSLLVLLALEPGSMRFTVLKREIGDISQRMLSQTLRRLEQDGLVERTVYPTIPPRVDYTLTPLGCSLLVSIKAMVDWAKCNYEAILTSRENYKPPVLEPIK